MRIFRTLMVMAFSSLLVSNALAGEAGRMPKKYTLESLNNGSIGPRELKGQRLVIQFWASWCVGCSAVMEHLAPDMTKDSKESRFLPVSVDENMDMAKSYFSNKPASVKAVQKFSYLDSDADLATWLGVKSLPVILLIEKDGSLVKTLSGHPTAEQYKMIQDFAAGNKAH